MSGPQVRAVARPRVSVGTKLAWLAVAVPVGALSGALGAEYDQPVFPLLGVALFAVLAGVHQYRSAVRRRLAAGMVRATPLQFDLSCAMAQLPAARVDEGRWLQDHLVALLRAPVVDQAAVRQCEAWMWQLATTAHQLPVQ
jgi:hypothetical protein